jgi:rare lipoprotein A
MERQRRRLSRIAGVATVAILWGLAAGLSVVSMMAVAAPESTPHTVPGYQVGKASFYASHYAGKTMADGTPMRLGSNNAASLTLPLGATARVTDLKTGRSAVVVIRDRGPYVKGRIIDLSPATARRIGLTRREGVALVSVALLAPRSVQISNP